MRVTKKRITCLIFAAFSVLLLFLSGLFIGSVRLGFSECLSGLFTGEGQVGVIVRSLRLPRVLAALVSGAVLAVSGALLQASLGNALASPSTLGVNSGAGAAVMLALAFFPGLFALESAFAFFGALFAAALTLAVGAAAGRSVAGSAVVLSGVAVGSLFGAVTSFLSLRFPDVLSSYAAFSVGGYAGVYARDIIFPALLSLPLISVAFLITPRLNVLALGDDLARSFGIRVGALRALCVVLAAALASVSVSFAGLIGFVGLIAPHIASRTVGEDRRLHLPMSALVGASLTLLSDMLGRALFAPGEIASGVILSLVGAPFFIALLITKVGRRQND